MAVICGREKWTLPTLLTAASHLSRSFSPVSSFFSPPSPALLVVMAVMTEKTVRRHREREIAETGETFGKEAGGKKGLLGCKMPGNRKR